MLNFLKKVGKFIGGCLIAPIALPLVAAQYGLKKAYKSARNIARIFTCDTYKWDRSLWRLLCIIAGGSETAKAGMALGGIIGSSLPVVGTVAGTIVGGIVGACLGIGLGAIVGKQTARLASWLHYTCQDQPCNKSERRAPYINHTNPDKYCVNLKFATKTDYVENAIFEVTNAKGVRFAGRELDVLLRALYQQKQAVKKGISSWAYISSWFASPADKRFMSDNDNYTKAVMKVRKGDIIKKQEDDDSTIYEIKITPTLFFSTTYNQRTQQWTPLVERSGFQLGG